MLVSKPALAKVSTAMVTSAIFAAPLYILLQLKSIRHWLAVWPKIEPLRKGNVPPIVGEMKP